MCRPILACNVFSSEPRRAVLLCARAVVATGVGVLVAAVSGVVAYVAARPVLSLPLMEGLEVPGAVAGVFAGSAALAVGLGFLLRSTAAVLVSAFLLLLVLPGLLPQLGYSWLTDIANWLPGTGRPSPNPAIRSGTGSAVARPVAGDQRSTATSTSRVKR